MKKIFGYIRVSTVKQGNGVSLQEQKEAIIRYAEKNKLEIIEWFEEQETAAKQGRPLFTQMLKLIRKGKACGVIIHKIDRGARNLKDWGSLGDLIDDGFEIHFAHESLDMNARGGRLAADIQAVIASDYIRNLREETIKGLYGRLKQGIYPFKAPIGYLDNGGGKVKTIDPVYSPLVKKAFELYASNTTSLDKLREKMFEYGLKTKTGKVMYRNTIATILTNPFYAGLIRIKDTIYQGQHEPLISPSMFNKVQDIMHGKSNTKIRKHDFIYRRSIKCSNCNYFLIGEKQKGHTYYRCQVKLCETKTVREERIVNIIENQISNITLNNDENQSINEILSKIKIEWHKHKMTLENSLKLQINLINYKVEKLTDAFLENIINKEEYNLKKEKLLLELKEISYKKDSVLDDKNVLFAKAQKFLELIINLKNTYKLGYSDDKREVLKLVFSNLSFSQNKLAMTMHSPFYEIANRYNLTKGVHSRTITRICTPELAKSDIAETTYVDKVRMEETMESLLNLILMHVEGLDELTMKRLYDIQANNTSTQ